MGYEVRGEGETFENLANTIIIFATKDYRKYLQKLFANPNNAAAKREIEKIERFFFSPWYEFLTNVPPEYLVRRLKADERIRWEEKQKKAEAKRRKAEEETNVR